MSDQKNIGLQETVSALVDDEATELELHRALNGLSEDSELRQKWRRYQLIGAVIRRERPAVAIDNSRKIAAAIDQEAGYSRKRWGQSIGKFAVAASVAGLTFIGIQMIPPPSGSTNVEATAVVTHSSSSSLANAGPQFQLPSGFEMPRLNTLNVSVRSAPVNTGPEQSLQSPRVDLQTHRQIKTYLQRLILRHAEQTSLLQSNYGTLPFARITSQQDEQ